MMQIINELKAAAGESKIIEGELMKQHTTFKAGGPADYYVSPVDKESLKNIVQVCIKNNLPYYILGNGSNLLVGDKGIRGVVINTSLFMRNIKVEGHTITADAGCTLARLARYALNAGLTGLEFAAGIPGTLGGAVVMNAGAYGSEIKNVIKSAEVLTTEGNVLTLSKEELELGYRTSCIEKNKYIVLSAVFELEEGDREAISSYMEELAAKRKDKQPLEHPSAGSTFKRPEGYFAGKLIQDSGLSGFRVGGASVSTKHCGFVVNDMEGTASDILELCHQVAQIVKEKQNVDLEMEIKRIGEF